MSYTNRSVKDTHSSKYSCCDDAMKLTCAIVSDHVIDGPISEAVICQIALPSLVEQILSKLTNEYEQAKEQSASYRREMKRLTTEIENLQDNLTNSMTKGILADGSIKAIDEQIKVAFLLAYVVAAESKCKRWLLVPPVSLPPQRKTHFRLPVNRPVDREPEE